MGGANAEPVTSTMAAAAIPATPAAELEPIRSREAAVRRSSLQPELLVLATPRRLRPQDVAAPTPRPTIRTRRPALVSLTVRLPQVPSIVNVDGRLGQLRIVAALKTNVEPIVRLQVELELKADGVRPSAAMQSVALPYVEPTTATHVSATTQPTGLPAGQTGRRLEEDPIPILEEVAPAVLRTPSIRHPSGPSGQVGRLVLQVLGRMSERLEANQRLASPADVVAASVDTASIPTLSPSLGQRSVVARAAPVARWLAEEARITGIVGRQVSRPLAVVGVPAGHPTEPNAAFRLAPLTVLANLGLSPPARPAAILIPIAPTVGLLRVAPSATSMGPSVAEACSRPIATIVHVRAKKARRPTRPTTVALASAARLAVRALRRATRIAPSDGPAKPLRVNPTTVGTEKAGASVGRVRAATATCAVP